VTRPEIEQKIIEYLEQYCDQDGQQLRDEYAANGDVEVDSLHFILIVSYMVVDMGINITPAQIDRHVKRSFKAFCDYVELISNRNR